ncbi:TRAP transporter small permease [Peptoniphilus indolicus]|uniref:TRAP-T family tripartite ATP-independent periplasmic transporter, membrane protein n=2 Tax=Peptoniphilus indolicus TaxID=33030 RepID=G4D6X8_9FIRM|nr:TRAP transporter small permease [Peptoniphilus indolicus]EGY76342.1 TRAP-T family tripartite ATP-independent periplasmic transporter, membrane protein [Peptoniphilus indolicus ATCC 29427]SUB75651.1 Neu5Ac permease [Peptoniphilus indolicus]
MVKLNNLITKVLKILIITVFLALIISCVLQVFTRFILNSSLSWTEELARYSFIWANLLGAALCTKNKSNATVSVVIENINEKNRKKLSLIINILTILIGTILIVFGSKVAWAVRTQLSPALRISMAFVYMAAPIFGALITFYSIYDIYMNMANCIGDDI